MHETAALKDSTLDAPRSPLLRAHGVSKTYRLGGTALRVLRGVDVAVAANEWVSIVGRSGSGKSTLLHLLGGLDTPDAGTVEFRETQVTALHRPSVDRYRREEVGFVFQFYHLLPELTAVENVLMGAMVRHGVLAWPMHRRAARERAEAMLERVGLRERMKHKPSKLSGGERQRVAIARALVNEPALLLADEPTGNLDQTTGRGVIELFESLHAEGQTIVMVTHDATIADAADRHLTLEEGRLVA
ncbi:MAG: ABC transporter ATP-binding protein [Phycisphaeraceae bacterium]